LNVAGSEIAKQSTAIITSDVFLQRIAAPKTVDAFAIASNYWLLTSENIILNQGPNLEGGSDAVLRIRKVSEAPLKVSVTTNVSSCIKKNQYGRTSFSNNIQYCWLLKNTKTLIQTINKKFDWFSVYLDDATWSRYSPKKL
jgi:hypothetical protein